MTFPQGLAVSSCLDALRIVDNYESLRADGYGHEEALYETGQTLGLSGRDVAEIVLAHQLVELA